MSKTLTNRQTPARRIERGRPVDDELLTTKDVAELLQISEVTLHRWRATGHGPAFHKVGRRIRYFRGDVMDFVRANA